MEHLVSVTGACESLKVLRGVKSVSHFALAVETGELPAQERAERAPINVALVLDRSGSMGGEKIKACRDAICKLIDELEGSDLVSLITFDNNLDVCFINENPVEKRAELKAKVQAIRVGGSTFLSGGLIAGALALGCKPQGQGKKDTFVVAGAKGLEFLADVPPLADAPDLKRIFLFSDGEANSGLRGDSLVTLAGEINASGATINAFGVGRDFNEDGMRGIARKGQGFYTYIKKPKYVDQYIQEALGNMKALIGTNAVLELRGVGCACVRRIFDHEEPNIAQLKDMRQSNKIIVVTEVELMPTDETADTAPCLEWTLTYKNAEGGDMVTLKGTVDAHFTSSPHDVEFDSKARSAVIQLITGDMDEEVVALLDAGKRPEAIEKKRASIALLEQAAELDPEGFAPQMLKGAQKTLKQMESSRSDAKVRKAAQYSNYLQRRCSISAMDQMAGYVVESDSSSEEEDNGPPAQGVRSLQRRLSITMQHDSNDSLSDDEDNLQYSTTGD